MHATGTCVHVTGKMHDACFQWHALCMHSIEHGTRKVFLFY